MVEMRTRIEYKAKEGYFTLGWSEDGYHLYLRDDRFEGDVPWAEAATDAIIRGSLKTLGDRRGNYLFRTLMKKLHSRMERLGLLSA